MRTGIEIYELKILKGPDRLLRIHVILSWISDLETELYMLAGIVDALLLKHHQLAVEFPVDEIIKVVPKNAKGAVYGEFSNGKLALEMLFMRRTESVINLRYYPEDLEFERLISNIDCQASLLNIDMDTYHFKYTMNDLRNGLGSGCIKKKVNFAKKV